MSFWCNLYLIVEGVDPNILHVAPNGENTILNWLLQFQNTSLGHQFITNLGIPLLNTHMYIIHNEMQNTRNDNFKVRFQVMSLDPKVVDYYTGRFSAASHRYVIETPKHRSIHQTLVLSMYHDTRLDCMNNKGQRHILRHIITGKSIWESNNYC